MSSELKQAMAATQLDAGLDEEWLAQLPILLDRCAKKWGLEFQSVMGTGAGVLIASRESNGSNVVLKLSSDAAAFEAERVALEAFGDRGSARLLGSAPDCSALLLEFVAPGTPLRSLTESGADDDACRVATEVATLIRVNATHEHVERLVNAGVEAADTLARHSALNVASTEPLPRALIERAASLVKELNESVSEQVVLHGDLHHDNILRSDRAGWLAIDPKGRIGDPAYEFAALMRNPIDYLTRCENLRTFLEQRAERLAALSGCDRNRITSWATAMAVVAACWQYEDALGGRNAWLRVAEALT